MKIAAVLTLALSLASAAIIPRMPQDTKTNTKDAAKAGSIKKVGGPSGATINWKATGSVLKKTSFKNSGLKCTDPSLDNLRKAWDKTNVPEYLKDWFAGFQDKNKSFGEKNFGHFPDVFAKSHEVTFSGDGCDWDDCQIMGCKEAEAKNLDPRAWLVMVAISNAQSKFHSFNDLMTQVTVEEYLSSSDNIVNEVTKNFHEPKDPSKFLEIFLTVGAELAGAATLRGPLAILPMVLNVWGAVGLDQPEFEQPWKKEDVKGSVRAAIGGSLKEYSKFARQSFSHVVMNGNAPRISKNKETTWSKKIEAGTGSALADYLGDKSLWAVETGGEESKKALAWVINRASLSAALASSEHFLLKNDMPARKKWAAKEWVANCNKLAGGWADEKAGVCYSLQGKRTTSDFPFSDNAAVGKMIKKKGNIFGIDSMKDFVHSVLDCAKTCNESHCGKTPKGLSKSVWAEGNIEKAKGNASKLATCSISIPVLDKDSLCDRDGGEDKKFPFNIDAKKCTMKIRQSDGRRFSDGKYEVTGMLGEVLAGKKSCGDKNAFNEYKFRDASVACSN